MDKTAEGEGLIGQGWNWVSDTMYGKGPSQSITDEPKPGAILNTMFNPFSRLTGETYVPKGLTRFPFKSDPSLNAALFQGVALGGTYLALAGLARYTLGLSEASAERRKRAKFAAERLGSEADLVIPGATQREAERLEATGVSKEAAVSDFLMFAIPVAALAAGLSGGYAIANNQLVEDRKGDLDEEMSAAEQDLNKAKEKALKRNEGLAKQAFGIPRWETMVGLAGLALASIYATSTLLAKKQFDSSDPARAESDASKAAFQSLTRARVLESGTDLRYIDQEKSLDRMKARKAKKAPPLLAAGSPEIPALSSQQPAVVRPYESVPV